MTSYQKSKDGPVILLIIDPQVDFHEGGSLAITGATADAERIAAMINANIDKIDEIYVTMDSHHVNHIAHQSFWEWASNKEASDGEGCEIAKSDPLEESQSNVNKNEKTRPKLFHQILSSDVKNGKWLPVDRSLRDYCIGYTQILESKGKFKLTIWPNHCLIGTTGHSVQPYISEAIQKWTSKKMKIVNFVHKGMNCLTEMYSAIEAEVPVSTDPTTTRNYGLLEKFQACKRLIVCGQAISHCVRWTVYDICKHWKENNMECSKMYFCEDGTSPVGGFEGDIEVIRKDLMNSRVTITQCQYAFQGL